MGHYVINFTVYTLAMSGLIFFAFFVYKKIMQGGINVQKSKNITVEETYSINPRKSLLVVRVGNERFLLASDVDKTNLISKLENESAELSQTMSNNVKIKEIENIYPENPNNSSFSEFMDVLQQNSTIKENDNIVETKVKQPVHLEIIKSKNPKSERRKSRYISNSNNTKIIEVGKNTDKAGSPIKGIVQKITNI